MPLENVPRPPYPTATTAFADLPGPPLPPVPSTPTLAASRQITPGTTMPAGGQTISRRGTPSAGTPPEQPPEVKYTVFLRLPFPRNDFVDPPPVDWDSTKERSLWKVISNHRHSELDWNLLADHYNVSAPFLLQQVAWLYERELSQVRAQLRKVGTTGTPLNSPGTPVPGANGQRALSAAGAEISRPSSAVANRPVMGGTPMSRTSSRNVPVQPVTSNSEDQAAAVAASTAGVVAAPPLSNGNGSVPMSRTPSASTARAPPTQSSQYFPTTPTLAGLDLYSLQQQPGEYQLASSPNGLTDLSPTPIRRSPSPSSSSSHSSRSSDVSSAVGTEHDGMRQTRRPGFRKFGTASRTAGGREPKDETDEEESPAFLPWTESAGDGANSTPAEAATPPATATAATPPATTAPADVQASVPAPASQPPTSRHRRPRTSNAGGYEPDRHENTSGGTIKRGLGIQQVSVQPYHPVSDSGTSTPGSQSSPRRRLPDGGRRGAESSPSMGSSFSDLSDASISQSALEDQFMSAVGNGSSTVSRMSSISHVLRGRQQQQHPHTSNHQTPG